MRCRIRLGLRWADLTCLVVLQLASWVRSQSANRWWQWKLAGFKGYSSATIDRYPGASPHGHHGRNSCLGADAGPDSHRRPDDPSRMGPFERRSLDTVGERTGYAPMKNHPGFLSSV